MRGWIASLIVLAGLRAGAEPSRPTYAGALAGWDRAKGVVTLRLDNGGVKQFHLLPQTRFEVAGAKCSGNVFHNGMQVIVRLCGPLSAAPPDGDLMADRATSQRYLQTTVTPSGYTRIGTLPTSGGTATDPMPVLAHGGQVSYDNGTPRPEKPGGAEVRPATPTDITAQVLEIADNCLFILAPNSTAPQVVRMPPGLAATRFRAGQKVHVQGVVNSQGQIDAAKVSRR